jgi:hypothetical protein
MERKFEINESDLNELYAALGELPTKVGFKPMYILQKKYDAVIAAEQALSQQAFAALEEKQTPTPQK